MEIYEKIFARLEKIHMSQSELSRLTGIPTSTISDWKKKMINPQADKLAPISKALGISLTSLLSNSEKDEQMDEVDYVDDEKHLIDMYRSIKVSEQKRISRYFELLNICEEINKSNKKIQRNVSIIQDIDGNNIVIINDIRFKGKRSVNWKEVKEYLKEFVGEFYMIASTGDVIYIGSDLPKEYSGSKYTNSIKGTNAKAKANASQGIPEMIEIAIGGNYKENNETKHIRDAKNGWFRYDSRFALPVYDADGEIERYNVFHASLLIRHSNDGKKYLYDVIDIKKETSNSLGS